MRVRCIAFSACRGRKSDWGSTVPFPLNGLKDETNPGSAKFNQSVSTVLHVLVIESAQLLDRLLL